MKKLILLFGLCSIIFGAASTQSIAGPVTQTIVVRKINTQLRPRGLEMCPVCEYDSTSKSVTVDFMEESGPFTVTVVNNITGEQWIESGDGGYCDVYISGESGEYTIYIDTVSGDSYSGDFSI